MIFDPVANFISSLKNGYLANKEEILVPYSQYKEEIAKVLVESNFLEALEKNIDKKTKKYNLLLKLKYDGKKPLLTDIKQVSKAGLRVYSSSQKIPKVLGGLGTSVISTPMGVMSTKKAKKLHVGGEIICHVW